MNLSFLKIKSKKQTLSSSPQQKVICIKVFVLSPKKPNSANRRVVKAFLKRSIGDTNIIVKIPGEGHSLQQHSNILIKNGRCRDLVGVYKVAIRGKFDLPGVANRKTSRSLYGVKRSNK